jgi:hypothetical protein
MNSVSMIISNHSFTRILKTIELYMISMFKTSNIILNVFLIWFPDSSFQFCLPNCNLHLLVSRFWFSILVSRYVAPDSDIQFLVSGFWNPDSVFNTPVFCDHFSDSAFQYQILVPSIHILLPSINILVTNIQILVTSIHILCPVSRFQFPNYRF